MANIPISALPNVQPSGYTPNDLLVLVNYDLPSGTTKNTSLLDISNYVLSGVTFTGNTSASCISDLYVTNVYGCSPITIHDSVQSVGSQATGVTSFAFGDNVSAFGNYSHAEGQSTQSIGDYSHAEGVNTISSGTSSHAEGVSTISPGDYSHAEGEAVQSVGGASHAEGYDTISYGQYSHAEGSGTQSIGDTSHAEGINNIAGGRAFSISDLTNGVITLSNNVDYSSEFIAGGEVYLLDSHPSFGPYAISSTSYSAPDFIINLVDTSINYAGYVVNVDNLNNPLADTLLGYGSHSEGVGSKSFGEYSHSEGNNTKSIGSFSHAEGRSTQTIGDTSHAEGEQTKSIGYASHSEGFRALSIGSSSHAEGGNTNSVGYASHAEGWYTISSGQGSHSEGSGTTSVGNYSHAEGYGTQAIGFYSHSEGNTTISLGEYSHSEGYYTQSTGFSSHAEGTYTVSSGYYSHAEGSSTISSGQNSHAEGENTISSGLSSHAEGNTTQSLGNFSHSEGSQTQSIGNYSHSEGESTQSLGNFSHAEGESTQSIGESSHAEGAGTISSGNYSHAEGAGTIASGLFSHAEGNITRAIGSYSHAEGISTIASGAYQHVSGRFNESGDTTAAAFIIGNGINNSSRSNLLFAAGNEVNISGKTITTNFQMTSGATDSYVLTSDSLGNGSWEEITTITGLTFNNGTYDLTVNTNTGNFTQSLYILAGDMTVTGGTYNPGNGDATFTTNSGGTFIVSGFLTGYTDTNIYTVDGSLTGNRVVDLNGYTLTFNNDIIANTVYVGKGSGSGSNIRIGDPLTFSVNTIGDSNIAMGYGALASNDSGNGNISIGRENLYQNQLGNYNVSIGNESLYSNFQGTSNTSVGHQSLYSNNNGFNNTSVGYQAGYDVQTGGNNTFIGNGTGGGIVGGNFNTVIGANVTGLVSSLSNNIILADGQGNRRINVDSNGYVGINVTSPTSYLHISGSTLIDGSQELGTTLVVNQSILGSPGIEVINSTQPIIKLTTGINYSQFSRTTGETYVYSSDAIPFNIYTNSVKRVTINGSSGNVGIGTTTPTELLDISGKTKTTNLQMTSGATNNYILKSDSLGNGSWDSLTNVLGYTPVNKTGDTMSGLLQFTGSGHAGIRLNNLTTVQRNAIVSPQPGMSVYDTNLNTVCNYNGTIWSYDMINYVVSNVTTTVITAANITGLAFSVESGSTYMIEGYYGISCSSTGGVKFTQTTPAGATMEVTYDGIGSSSITSVKIRSFTSGVLTTTSINSANTSSSVIIRGFVKTSVTAGTLQFQFASTTNGQTSTLKSSSWLKITKIS